MTWKVQNKKLISRLDEIVERYRTVPWFDGRRQVASASWTQKYFDKSLKVVQGHSKLRRWVERV